MSAPTLAYLAAFASALAIALLGLTYKVAAERQSRAMPFTLAFLATAGVLALAKTLTETTAWHDPRLWAMSLSMGVLFFLGIPQIMLANKLGPASVNWTFVNLGLIVPIAVAPALFHESLLVIDLLTLALFVLMLLAFARGMATGDETKPEHLLLYVLLLASVLLNNGIAMTILKLKGRLLPDSSAAAFAAIFYLSGALFTAITALVTERRQRPRAADWWPGILAGACSGAAILFMLAAVRLPAVVLFPLTQGVGLVGGVLLTTLLYRERLNPSKVLGLCLGAAVLLSASLRETLAALLG